MKGAGVLSMALALFFGLTMAQATTAKKHAASTRGKSAAAAKSKTKNKPSSKTKAGKAAAKTSPKAARGKAGKQTLSARGATVCVKKKGKRVCTTRRGDASKAMAATPYATSSAGEAMTATLENAQALEPFFTQLRAMEAGEKHQTRILHWGDSHTAADMFTGEMRARLQTRFGDAGAGFSAAGYPFLGYRIHGTRRAQTGGWVTLGTHLRDVGDGLLGLGGVAIETDLPNESASVEADAEEAEIFYLTQPNGGRIAIYEGDNSPLTRGGVEPIATLDTAGETGAGAFTLPAANELGRHRRLEARTLDAKPVRLFGFVTANEKGLTYETMGINGAEASLITKWNETIQSFYITRRAPALIVLDYGTNEAAHDWTGAGYKEMFLSLLARLKKAAPDAAFLVLGPTDRDLKAGRRKWANFHGTERITEAQRAACKEFGCAFWSQQEAMGGWGSMSEWAKKGLAQGDHTHLTGPGYVKLADDLSAALIDAYEKSKPAK